MSGICRSPSIVTYSVRRLPRAQLRNSFSGRSPSGHSGVPSPQGPVFRFLGKPPTGISCPYYSKIPITHHFSGLFHVRTALVFRVPHRAAFPHYSFPHDPFKKPAFFLIRSLIMSGQRFPPPLLVSCSSVRDLDSTYAVQPANIAEALPIVIAPFGVHQRQYL